MKYEKPEVMALSSAINTIQDPKIEPNSVDSDLHETFVSAYADWE
jgi:hypothetical protein